VGAAAQSTERFSFFFFFFCFFFFERLEDIHIIYTYAHARAKSPAYKD
jgi:hypothetical protein